VIAVKKLDGSMMHINEDLVERVEGGADGKSTVYLMNGGHIIVANEPATVVEGIRAEKVALLRRVLQGPDDPGHSAVMRPVVSGVARLSKVRSQ
jgi:uncharacterized protein YlzI (FlbEa/FlbD family)